jgi:hypothetical protein
MISLELAKRLKDAGLWWEWPSSGDFIYNHMANRYGCVDEWIYTKKEVKKYWEDGRVDFAPRLDQLLGEIEKRGYEYEQGVSYVTGGPMMPGRYKHGYWCEIWFTKDLGINHRITADTPEEAVAQALLWILEREGK